MPKNSTDLSLEILEKVDGFYSKSFEKLSNFYSESFQNLILYISWFGAVAGLLILVGLPFLIQAIQKRFFKVESQEIKKSLHEELTKEFELEIKKISKEYREREMELEKQLKDLDNKRKRDVTLME
jgi:multidrug efflux pump subunit AcrB